MAQLPDYYVNDFSGGLIRNKSDYQMDKNELRKLVNFDIDNRGRLLTRRGYQRFSTDSSGTMDNLFNYARRTTTIPNNYLLAVNRASAATLSRIISNSLLTAITTSTVTITCPVSTSNFAASGSVEIEGDIIAYTGKSGDTLTGVTGILKAHPAGAPVRQTQTITLPTDFDTRFGITFSILNNICYLSGEVRAGNAIWSYDGTTVDDNVANSPTCVLNEIYRNRIYVAGQNEIGGHVNGSRIRVVYSGAGDGTSWTASDYFDVEENRSEEVSALKVLNDILLIFKPNSTWAYDEVQLKQRSSSVGAYNQRVVQEIDGRILTFCPEGIYITNGSTFKKISEPIAEYLTTFHPQYNPVTSDGRVTLNTFAWTFEKKYYLYIGDITAPETLTDVVLVYDTELNNWTIYTGFTDFTNCVSMNRFADCGDVGTAGTQPNAQAVEAVFGMDNTGTMFRLFDSSAIDTSNVITGGDILADNIDNSAGVPISAYAETKWYDMGNPTFNKTIKQIRVMVEQGFVNLFYQIDDGEKITDPIPLGEFTPQIQRKKLPINSGFRFKLLISTASQDVRSILNGFVFEDIEMTGKI